MKPKMGQHTISSILLWVYVANLGSLAYVFPEDLINHDTPPAPNSGSPGGDTAALCEPQGVYTKTDPSNQGCQSYIRCNAGKAMVETCKDQLIFDGKSKSCRNPTLEEYSKCILKGPKPTNYNSFGNQQVSPSSLANQQIPSNSLANQQVPSTFPNQQVPTNSFFNQQASSSSSFSNQQASSSSFSTQQSSSNSSSNQQVSSNSFSSQQILGNQQRPTVGNPVIQTTYRPYQQTQSGQNTQYNAPNQPVSATSGSGFVCPPSNFFAFGDHNRYPAPGTCHRFYICLRDGTVKVGGCQPPTAFDPISQVCVSMQSVPNCK